ncbi:ABC transporter permease [Streptomyces sp. NBC_01340]|uniref:ABC transporter permease n=1 Tax=unclassified Streptomyces TaxID=2593676 RepID=UPI00224FE797|nr:MULTISPECIES: FtsX-like permease family protein [unclassified Streptomyces]MCX4456534.1 ABC transporter permease [Streptomyces sp. NBC_01719]MCX4495892.1 ABC transporter permease [Streptomyces sp. NBC_01728]WSI40834.1 ABC transporter permease [Streptomyces sp. NBC_01340]
MSMRQWSKDLAMGVRFAFSGGREGWVRALLTAVGVGLGVALLLLTTAIPNALAARDHRSSSRNDFTYSGKKLPKADDTLVIGRSDTTFREKDVRGRLLEAEGPQAPLPPGVGKFPAKGDMVVSPALDRLLKSDGGKLLRDRLPYRVTGTIGQSGLIGPAELAYYAGVDGLASQLANGGVERIDYFGPSPGSAPDKLDPVLLLLVLMVFIVLLMPVGVFIAAAVRFGGERRDRRLAALRLVGADGRMVRRIAGGEALAGALLGLVLGTGFFLAGRQLATLLVVRDISMFPSDLNPSPALAVLVALAVPAAAVLVTLFALRGVVIEPLGVVRTAKPPRRRLWWRLLLPLGGLGLLYPMIGQGNDNGNFNQWLVIGGTVLLLVGVTALLPWVVEAVVARLNSGSVSWQLAVRRLQLSSGTAARMVNGIAVAVAGAIALQMLFAGVDGDYTKQTANDVTRAQMEISLHRDVQLGEAGRQLARTEGVRRASALSLSSVGDRPKNPDTELEVAAGSCAELREVARLASCKDGDAFWIRGGEYDNKTKKLIEPGSTLYFDPSYDETPTHSAAWKVPADLKTAEPREDPTGYARGGLLVTSGALPANAADGLSQKVFVTLDPSVPDAGDYARNTAARLDPLADVFTLAASKQSQQFRSIRTGLFVGATCVLLLIGASLLVSQLEQLRERKKLLSALVAFGTRRRTLSLSVLWQTAIPIGLGMALASVVGLTLGAVLLKMTNTSVRLDWVSVLSMSGIGAGVVLLVTLFSLPPLLRLMRPDGLRTE